MKEKLQRILQEKFWLESFRDSQEAVINSVVQWNDTIVFMPTWWWKSLTYQLPGLYLDWIVLVISPLISLMKDQVDKLNGLWIRAELLNSTIDTYDKQILLNEISKPNTDIKFLYIAPERLNSDEFIRIFSRTKIALVAIDEAHCISQWWHDFRPSYMKIRGFLDRLRNPPIPNPFPPREKGESSFIENTKDYITRLSQNLRKESTDVEQIALLLSPLGGKVGIGGWIEIENVGNEWNFSFPIMALTATATKKVRLDIIERLWLKTHNVFTSWFDRKNITLIVREISKKEEKMQKVLEIIQKTPWVWIIYCASRKAVKEVYEDLLQKWIKAWIYTWAMNSDHREIEQNEFMKGDNKVIVATNAFGMWIDKKDIRFVIHYNLPWSIENYYQEVWRAWRDGKNSYWIVIASFWDTKIQEFFIENTYPSKDEILTLYDYLYYSEKEWFWKWKAILKTYSSIASESGISNDMKVWSALRILEKYGIIKRWVDSDFHDDEFRWKWLTLNQEKRKHSNLLIDWEHQNLLKEESYFKLEQIKKLLFYPRCRKRFILEYFWDDEDLATLWEKCWTCDYCIERKKHENTEVENYVNLSVFALVLDVVKKIDEKIWVVMMTKFLWWSKDKKLIEWNMDRKENFWALEDLTSELIQAVIEALISLDYLYKTEGKYPLLWITDTWKVAIIRDHFLKDDNRELQHYIKMKIWPSLLKSRKMRNEKFDDKEKKVKWETYTETLKLFQEWKNISEIAEIRWLKQQTIENHFISLYLTWKLGLNYVMKLIDFQNVKFIKTILNKFFSNWYEWLKEIKDKCLEEWKTVSRIDINATIAMIKKWDL